MWWIFVEKEKINELIENIQNESFLTVLQSDVLYEYVCLIKYSSA